MIHQIFLRIKQINFVQLVLLNRDRRLIKVEDRLKIEDRDHNLID